MNSSLGGNCFIPMIRMRLRFIKDGEKKEGLLIRGS